MRSNDTTMPPARGMHAPDRPVPLPRAVTGDAVLVADAEDRGDLACRLWQQHGHAGRPASPPSASSWV